MPQTAIFMPFFAMLFLTFLVWVYMYAKRIPFIQSNDIPRPITPEALQQLSPPSVSNPSDNLKNLFEMPVLFYALVLFLYVTQLVDGVHVWMAWGYVLLRALHSIVHCTFNHVMLRFGVYAASSVLLFVMVVRGFLGL